MRLYTGARAHTRVYVLCGESVCLRVRACAFVWEGRGREGRLSAFCSCQVMPGDVFVSTPCLISPTDASFRRCARSAKA